MPQSLLTTHSSSINRVLVIDDDPMQLEYIGVLLRSMGINDVFCAAEGSAALPYLDDATMPLDLIICDLLMPTMDGFDVLWQLAKRECKTPLIINSGQSANVLHSAVLVAHLKSLNLVGQLKKPTTPEQFIKLINDFLDDQNSTR
ncbi:response regulator [Undibacterium sp. Di24W]|uniref:response regulator n=1 Tax=Undibacterium sp. Di24W TaxID=3413033 RepID=UPI003BF2621D